MMALLTRSFCEREGAFDSAPAIAEQYAWQVAQYLVPEKYKKAFDARFKPPGPVQRKETQQAPSDYLITASRQAISEQLDDLLWLREFKIQANHPVLSYGGLGGILLEGEPGAGKSELVIAKLRAQGFKEVDGAVVPEKPFYRMPVSLSTEEQKKLLLKGFHEGAVVVIDEINSSKSMERFLNHLLMGKTAEGDPPKKPGFLLIGTQNPADMGGREAAGTALSRRFVTTKLPSYNAQETEAILLSKGVEQRKIRPLVNAFEKNVKKAKQEKLTPPPTLREVLRVAESELPFKVGSAMGLLDGKPLTMKHPFFTQSKDRESAPPGDNIETRFAVN
jgi:hypothetical protein